MTPKNPLERERRLQIQRLKQQRWRRYQQTAEQSPSGKAFARCVEDPEIDSGHNLFLFFSFSFRLVFILGITVLLCFYIQFLDLQIFFSALLAVPPKSFARSCDLRISCILLADASENFRKKCLQYYKLDPCHYFTSPELSWDAVLKMTQVKLELMTYIDMFQFIEIYRYAWWYFIYCQPTWESQ